MDRNSKIYVAGNTGLVGSAIVRNLQSKGYKNFIYSPFEEYDLREQSVVRDFFRKENPNIVFLAAAKVGGIVANNTYRAEFIYDNLQIQSNIIHEAYKTGVEKLVFLGSSCIYPKNSPQPMKESHLLTSELEYTNEPYAVAKIAGIKLIESYNLQYGTNFIAVMPTNLYGPNDNFDLEKSHVLPALIRKMHLGKALAENNFELIREDFQKRPVKGLDARATDAEISSVLSEFGIDKSAVKLWGTGKPRREFLHSDDLADACVFLAEKINFSDILKNDFGIEEINYPYVGEEVKNTHINIGTGRDISIKELAELIQKEVVDYSGELIWDANKPDGTFRKLMDVKKLHDLGWKDSIDFTEGIKAVYKSFKNN
jgi:GDP-L-fucose synthase